MCARAVVWCIFASGAIFGGPGADGKTYYFNVNKTSNEFLIYNRVNLNKSVQNYATKSKLGEIANISVAQRTNDTKKFAVLDPEWDYVSHNVTREEPPIYIQKFYESTAREINNSVNYATTRILFNTMPRNSTIIKFNLDSLDSNDNISNVELYFYLAIEKNLTEKPLVLRLYQIVDDYPNSTSLVNPDVHKLLNVIYVRQAESGWQIFKLLSGVQNWLKGAKNSGLMLTISKPNQNQFSLFKDTNNGTLRTFAVVKSSDTLIMGNSPGKEAVLQPGSCRKHVFYVDFKRFNWLSFIIAPEGYTAFNCFGKCYKNDNTLPNHTKVLNADTSRKSFCCVATDYNPLPIMFYDKYGNIAIKVYKDMVAARCGCR